MAVRYVLEKDQRFTRPHGRGVVVIEPEVRGDGTRTKPAGRRFARVRCDCGAEFLVQVPHLFHDPGWVCPGCPWAHGNGARGVKQEVKAGQEFGRFGKPKSVVIEPEIRLGCTPEKPHGYRYARLLCPCGTKYLAQISHLFHDRSLVCPECSRRAQHAKRRRVGGRIKKDTRGSGFNVEIHVGYYRSLAEAEDIARRARVVLLPKVPPVTL